MATRKEPGSGRCPTAWRFGGNITLAPGRRARVTSPLVLCWFTATSSTQTPTPTAGSTTPRAFILVAQTCFSPMARSISLNRSPRTRGPIPTDQPYSRPVASFSRRSAQGRGARSSALTRIDAAIQSVSGRFVFSSPRGPRYLPARLGTTPMWADRNVCPPVDMAPLFQCGQTGMSAPLSESHC